MCLADSKEFKERRRRKKKKALQGVLQDNRNVFARCPERRGDDVKWIVDDFADGICSFLAVAQGLELV